MRQKFLYGAFVGMLWGSLMSAEAVVPMPGETDISFKEEGTRDLSFFATKQQGPYTFKWESGLWGGGFPDMPDRLNQLKQLLTGCEIGSASLNPKYGFTVTFPAVEAGMHLDDFVELSLSDVRFDNQAPLAFTISLEEAQECVRGLRSGGPLCKLTKGGHEWTLARRRSSLDPQTIEKVEDDNANWKRVQENQEGTFLVTWLLASGKNSAGEPVGTVLEFSTPFSPELFA